MSSDANKQNKDQLVCRVVINSELLCFLIKAARYAADTISIKAKTSKKTGARSMKFTLHSEGLGSMDSKCQITDDAFDKIDLWCTFAVVINAIGPMKVLKGRKELIGLSFYGEPLDDIDDGDPGDDDDDDDDLIESDDEEEYHLTKKKKKTYQANITHYKLHIASDIESVLKWNIVDVDQIDKPPLEADMFICRTKVPKLMSVLDLVKISDDASATVEDRRNEMVIEAGGTQNAATRIKLAAEKMNMVMRARCEPIEKTDGDDVDDNEEEEDQDEEGTEKKKKPTVYWRRITLEYETLNKVQTKALLYSEDNFVRYGSESVVFEEIDSLEMECDFNFYFGGTYLRDMLSLISSHVGDDDIFLNFGFKIGTRSGYFVVLLCAIKYEGKDVGRFAFTFGAKASKHDMGDEYLDRDNDDIELSDGDVGDEEEVELELFNTETNEYTTSRISDQDLMNYIKKTNMIGKSTKSTPSRKKKKTKQPPKKRNTTTKQKNETQPKKKKTKSNRSHPLFITSEDVPDFFSDDDDEDDKKNIKLDPITVKEHDDDDDDDDDEEDFSHEKNNHRNGAAAKYFFDDEAACDDDDDEEDIDHYDYKKSTKKKPAPKTTTKKAATSKVGIKKEKTSTTPTVKRERSPSTSGSKNNSKKRIKKEQSPPPPKKRKLVRKRHLEPINE